MTVSDSMAEPMTDLQAQFAAVLDPMNPKDAMFIARHNHVSLGDLPRHVLSVANDAGVLLTTNPHKAAAFSRPGLDNDRMAAILDYPVTKRQAAASVRKVAIQARDKFGSVVHECLAPADDAASVNHMNRYVPAGGTLVVSDPVDALLRRVSLSGVR